MTSTTTPPTPPEQNARGAGRKPLPKAQKRHIRSIRMTDAEWVDFNALGGREWLSDAIAYAKSIAAKKESPP